MINRRTLHRLTLLLTLSATTGGCATLNERIVDPISTSLSPSAASEEDLSSAQASSQPFAKPGSLSRLRGRITPPAWNKGDWWTYSDGYGLRVTSIDEGTTTFHRTDTPDQWFTRKGFFRDRSSSATSTRQVIYRTLEPEQMKSLSSNKPLTFQREYLSNGELRTHATSWTVEGKKRITVPAGTFDTWVIVWRTRNITTNWSGFERWYYAPDVKHYVRMEYRYGTMPTMSRVLMDYWIMDWMQETALDLEEFETASTQ